MKSRIRLPGFFLALAILVTGFYPALAIPAEPQQVKIPLGGGHELSGAFFVPSASGPAAAVLVLHTRGGMRKADVDYAAALAEAGFVSLAVSYYPSPRYDPNDLHHPGYVEELLRAVDWLQSRPEAKGQPVGVVGFSLGSKAVTLSARHSAIKAVVSYYGVFNLRILPRAMGRKTYPTMPVDVAAEVRAPVLLFHGTEDDETPLDQAESMRDALVKAGKSVELVVYPDATHSFDRGHPGGGCGTTDRGFYYCLDSKARDDAWNRTLSWFKKYLAAP